MTHLTGTNADLCDFAAELKERAPDLSDAEVLLAVDEYDGKTRNWTTPGSPMGIVLIACYDGGLKNGSKVSRMFFGFDMTKEKS